MGILKHTWIYKFCNTIHNIYLYNKDKGIVGDIIYGYEFKQILRKYLGADIHKDWIGRLYCVINPNIDEYGKFDITRVVIEFDDNTTHNEQYVKNYLYKQLDMVRELFKLHRLYDYINMEVRHVGPDTEDNYLVVISLVTQNMMLRSLKKLFNHTILYMGLATAALTYYLL